MKYKLLLSSITIALLFSACDSDSKKSWTPFIYPDKNNQKRSMQLTDANSLQECKEISSKKLLSLGLKDVGSSKCGLNCTYHEGMKQLICEEMKNI